MKIAIFGLGYVGCVSAACLADMGHHVIGVDVNGEKLKLISRGEAPIIEPGLDECLARVLRQGNLRATASTEDAVQKSEVSVICVGTPGQMNGRLDTRSLEHVMQEVGKALARVHGYHVVVIRSTLLPGILRETMVPIIEAASGRIAGVDFGICVNPEFLREGSAIRDFRCPPFIVVGELNPRDGDALVQMYQGLNAPVYRLTPDAAAILKYASNAYHALKTSFANEIGTLCRQLNIDSHQVMDVFIQDQALNISPAYLKPGFAFGGSCLPKDVRALLYAAKHLDVRMPVLEAVLPSNDLHIQRVLDVVGTLEKRRVSLIGLSFKRGTDDLRESPLVRLAEALIGKGLALSVYDTDVSLSNVFGRNREYIERVLPHVNRVLSTDLGRVVNDAEVLIVGKRFPEFVGMRGHLRPDQTVIDLNGSNDWSPAVAESIV
jgi:GDP-mannose 6-dehydrogenase